MTDGYLLNLRTFRKVRDDKAQALRPLEEAADAFGAWQRCDDILTEPDSWEKLEEDLDRCIKADSLCAYSPSEECSTCVLPRDSQCRCDSWALEAIKERIRKLRGEGE